jgi:hypothetical protein
VYEVYSLCTTRNCLIALHMHSVDQSSQCAVSLLASDQSCNPRTTRLIVTAHQRAFEKPQEATLIYDPSGLNAYPCPVEVPISTALTPSHKNPAHTHCLCSYIVQQLTARLLSDEPVNSTALTLFHEIFCLCAPLACRARCAWETHSTHHARMIVGPSPQGVHRKATWRIEPARLSKEGKGT